MSNTSPALYCTIMQSALVDSGFWFGGLDFFFFFLELFPVHHSNLYSTAPTTHLKNPHIHWLGPFCWEAVSQWLPFFMLVVQQIKAETTDEGYELMGTEINCWKNEWCQHQLCLLNCQPRAAGEVSGTTSNLSWAFPIISTLVVSCPNSPAFLSHLFFPCPETLHFNLSTNPRF